MGWLLVGLSLRGLLIGHRSLEHKFGILMRSKLGKMNRRSMNSLEFGRIPAGVGLLTCSESIGLMTRMAVSIKLSFSTTHLMVMRPFRSTPTPQSQGP